MKCNELRILYLPSSPTSARTSRLWVGPTLAAALFLVGAAAAASPGLPPLLDPSFESCLLEHAARYGWEDVREVDSLLCSRRGIERLDGVEALTHLTKLDLSQNRIVDPTPLSPLSSLLHLELSGNSAIDPILLYPVLAYNSQLIHLGLADIPVGGFAQPPLTDETGTPYALIELNLANADLSDASGLIDFTTLEVLDLSHNHIEDLELVAFDGASHRGLIRLRELDASDNRLTALVGLRGLTHLERFDVSGNPGVGGGWDALFEVDSILAENPGLTHVGLGDLALGMFPAPSLSDWRTGEPYRLVELNLHNTRISDTTGLIEFRTLEVLDLSRNDIEELELGRHVGPGPNDFDGLSGLVNLDVSDNRLTSLSGLDGISTLERLDLSGNDRIGLFEPGGLLEQLELVLSANQGLRRLGLRDIPITDLAALPVFNELVTEPRLLEVDLAHTRTSDVKPLGRQPGLRVVDLGNNLIADPLGLLGLTSPTWVNLVGNPGIPCPDLDTLESLWGPGVLQRPNPCFTPQHSSGGHDRTAGRRRDVPSRCGDRLRRRRLGCRRR